MSQLLAEDAKINDDHRRKLASIPPTELEVTTNDNSSFDRLTCRCPRTGRGSGLAARLYRLNCSIREKQTIHTQLRTGRFPGRLIEICMVSGKSEATANS